MNQKWGNTRGWRRAATMCSCVLVFLPHRDKSRWSCKSSESRLQLIYSRNDAAVAEMQSRRSTRHVDKWRKSELNPEVNCNVFTRIFCCWTLSFLPWIYWVQMFWLYLFQIYFCYRQWKTHLVRQKDVCQTPIHQTAGVLRIADELMNFAGWISILPHIFPIQQQNEYLIIWKRCRLLL